MKNLQGLSIIIPSLNEKDNLFKLIDYIKNFNLPKYEIIVVEGGTDFPCNTFYKNQPEIKIVNHDKGRAKQLNRGAEIAKFKWLYFLHSDCIPPKNFKEIIYKSMNNKNQASCFKLKFKPSNFFLSLSSKATKYNNIFCRGGDQSLLIHKNLLYICGGFDENFKVCEDINLINKIYMKGEFNIMEGHITTDSRRFLKNGTLKLLIHFGIIHLLHYFKFNPDLLYKYYKLFIK
jgi:rSAM/selenodomain-associated transferase 2